jgi:hypothetical protein
MIKHPSMAAIIWFLAFFVVSMILLRSLWVTSDEPSDVIFDNKVFYDTGQTALGDGVVSISGTLTGEGVGNKNNTATVTCYQDRMECLTYSIAQIGPNQLGKLDVPSIFPITKWDNNEIVAIESGDTLACVEKQRSASNAKRRRQFGLKTRLIKLSLHVKIPTPRHTSGRLKIRHFGSAAKSEPDPILALARR